MKNKINIYAVEDVLKVAKMLEAQGMVLESIFTKESDLKFKNKELDIFGHKVFVEGKTSICVTKNTEEKYHRLWYKLTDFNETKFESWTLASERTEYKGVNND